LFYFLNELIEYDTKRNNNLNGIQDRWGIQKERHRQLNSRHCYAEVRTTGKHIAILTSDDRLVNSDRCLMTEERVVGLL
jgi:hypothetical protein